jgi:hypothetical protein
MPSILFFCGGTQTRSQIERDNVIWDLVRDQTKYKIKILTEREEDRKLFEDFEGFESVASLERSIRCVGKIDNTLLETYSKRYSTFHLQKLRIPTNLRGAHLFQVGSSSFPVVLCRYFVAMESIIVYLNPDFVCLTLGEAFNHPCIPILDAVCQLQNRKQLFVGRPMSRIMVTDNMARASKEIENMYVHKLEAGLSDREKRVTIDAIENYKTFKRSEEAKALLSKDHRVMKSREKIWPRIFSRRYVYERYLDLQFRLWRSHYKYPNSLDWNPESNEIVGEGDGEGGRTRGKSGPYVLLLLNKNRNYRTTFLTPFESDITSVICNVAISLPLTHTLVVREHPGTRLRRFEYSRAAYQLANVRFAARESDLFDLIDQSEVVLTLASTSLLDGLIMGKPVILLGRPAFMVGSTRSPFFQMENWKDLSKLLERCRQTTIPTEEVLAYFYSFLSNTASMYDMEGVPDWPDEKRAALTDLPWYTPGSRGLTNIGLKLSRYIAQFD